MYIYIADTGSLSFRFSVDDKVLLPFLLLMSKRKVPVD